MLLQRPLNPTSPFALTVRDFFKIHTQINLSEGLKAVRIARGNNEHVLTPGFDIESVMIRRLMPS